MPTFTSADVIYFVAFVVPGFISMQVYGLVLPREKTTLKDSILEAITYGAINFVVLFFPIRWAANVANFAQHPVGVWLAVIGIFLVFPCCSPLALIQVRKRLAKWGWALIEAPTAWDHFFQAQQACWVLVHISETRRVGGWFGENSYASSYPEPGHLYIEELWELDAKGGFVQKEPQSHGILLRPGDYQMVEFFDNKRPEDEDAATPEN
ncbi:MAG TPA: DUF6338 family protein [Rhizomicrobium sp.]|jgi:hypothetical protein|nr:DUF6338 family protein [Rhizomicrobium sp.]